MAFAHFRGRGGGDAGGFELADEIGGFGGITEGVELQREVAGVHAGDGELREQRICVEGGDALEVGAGAVPLAEALEAGAGVVERDGVDFSGGNEGDAFLVVVEGLFPAGEIVGDVAQGAVGFGLEIGAVGFGDGGLEVFGGGGLVAAALAGESAEVVGFVEVGGGGVFLDVVVGGGFGGIELAGGVLGEAGLEVFALGVGGAAGGEDGQKARGWRLGERKRFLAAAWRLRRRRGVGGKNSVSHYTTRTCGVRVQWCLERALDMPSGAAGAAFSAGHGTRPMPRDRGAAMILEKIIEHGVEAPNSVAIVDDKRTLTYRELAYGANLFVDHVNTLAPLAEFGDKVGLLIPPTAAFAVAFGGTRWADRIAMPLNYLLKAEELAGIVRDSGVKVVFTIEHFKGLMERVVAAVGEAGEGESGVHGVAEV